jgi:hypothetical protein
MKLLCSSLGTRSCCCDAACVVAPQSTSSCNSVSAATALPIIAAGLVLLWWSG